MVYDIPDWDQYFLDLLPLIKRRSKDLSTKFGAVIVSPENGIKTTGYNSFPRGIDDHVPERQERPEKYYWMVHAEKNAICFAAAEGIALKGCSIYIDGMPCPDCAQMIVQTRLKKVIYSGENWQSYLRICEEKGVKNTWLGLVDRSVKMFKEAGVEIVEHFGEAPF